jgi:hypothetical protein
MRLKFVLVWTSVLVLALAVAAVVLIVPALHQRNQTGGNSGPYHGNGVGNCQTCGP